MLANGITLGFKAEKATGQYTVLEGLKEVPEFGVEPEKVENTTLSDTVKQYEFGIGDVPEMEYKFKYTNDKATDTYRVMRKLAESKKVGYFEQTYPDGMKVQFTGQVAVKLGGGGVNAVIEFTLKIALASDLAYSGEKG